MLIPSVFSLAPGLFFQPPARGAYFRKNTITSVLGWPDGFVPVPIHSIARSEDDALVCYGVLSIK